MKRKTFYTVLIMHFILQANFSFGQPGFCDLVDWTALKALYESTNGDNWTINTGWEIVKTDEPPEDCDLQSLYGVRFDGECFVDDEGVVDCYYPLEIFDIFLDNNNLNGTIPPEIGNLSFLELLGLSNNGLIGSLPKEIAKLSSLEYLGVNDNQINGCYNEQLKILCSQLSTSDNAQDISNGNNFDASWDSFCDTGNGSCTPLSPPSCRKTDSLALIPVLQSLGVLSYIDLEYPIDYWPAVSLNKKGCVDAIEVIGYNTGFGLDPAIGDLSEITKIVVIENSLSGPIPSEIGNLTTLEHLDLSGNQITEIPASIGKLTNLKRLYLGYFNNIEYIPSSIGDLINLEHLELSANPLREIPASIGNLQNLKYLDISGTFIESLPESIGNLWNLTTFWASSNFLSKLPASLGNLNQLSTLLLNDNQLTGELPVWLANMEALAELQIFNNQFGPCYNVDLEPLCDQLSADFNTNANISNGNNFDSDWEAFCFNREGACNTQPLTCRQTDSLALLKIYQSLKPDNTWSFGKGVTFNENGCVDKLDLSEDALNGTIPSAIGDLSEITHLDLVENNLTGVIPEEIGYLTTLEFLYLFENQLEGSIPKSIQNLTNLRVIELADNQFTELPPISNLTNLTGFFIRRNNFSGCYPNGYSQLCDQLLPGSNTNFAISEGNNFDATWEDFCATGTGNCTPTPLISCRQTDSLALIEIYQSLNAGSLVDFSKPMQEWPGVLLNVDDCVIVLDLKGNNLSGEIHPAIGDLSEIIVIDLSENLISGPIPSEIENLSNLLYLNLNENNITGALPSSIGNLHKLEYLNVYNNQITEIPTSIGNLTSLYTLDVGANQIQYLPGTIENLANIVRLLVNDNQIFGQLPAWVGNFEILDELQIQNNQFSGCYAGDLKRLCGKLLPEYNNNSFISDGNNFGTTWEVFCTTENGTCDIIQPTCRQTDSLALIAIYQSLNATGLVDFSKPIDDWFGVTLNEKGCVNTLNLTYSNLSGEIPAEIGDLNDVTFINFLGNNIRGTLPAEIGSLTELNYLDVGFNQIEYIPETIGELSNLTTLFLDGNKLTQLPSTFSNLNNLAILFLNDNQLTGQLPIWLAEIELLSNLQIQNNQLSGCYADELKQLCNQSYFFYDYNISDGNNFDTTWEDFCATGDVTCTAQPPGCRQTDSLALLKIYQSLKPGASWDFSQTIDQWRGVTLNENGCVDMLYLYEDGLDGTIPDAIGDLSEITHLYLTENKLTGSIPAEIGNLTKLKVLELHENQLTGPLPESIGELTNLTALVLSQNQFIGQLPPIGNLTNLKDLYLFSNQFSDCYPDEYKQLCVQLYPNSNKNWLISDGNNFDISWEDFCTGLTCNNKANESEQIESFSYPNPFSTYTTINYTLTEPAEITLTVYDALGKQVALLLDKANKRVGEHSTIFESSTLPEGIYYCQIQSSKINEVVKMILKK